jgi:hypothetical protein
VAENSQLSANGRHRGQGRPFTRGVSGNPGGRPRAALDVQELARQHTPDAIKALVDALSSPRERVSAAVALLDRGWGRPTQHVAGDAEGPPVAVTYTFHWADAVPQQEPEPDEAAVEASAAAFVVTLADESAC